MGSASSPTQKSHTLTPSAKCTNGLGILAMAAVAALTATLALQRLPTSPATILGAACCMAGVLTMVWFLHLRSAGFALGWNVCLALLMSGVLTAVLVHVAAQGWTHWWSSLGCGVFVYVMLWVLSMHERERGLQPIATAALALSMGVVARPPVIFACILLSLVIFLDQRRSEAGLLSTLMLLFTPAFLCAVLLGFLDHIWPGGLVSKLWDMDYSGDVVTTVTVLRYEALILRGSATLALVVAVLAARVLEKQVGKTDLGFVLLFVFLVSIGTMRTLPGRLTIDDLRLVLTCSACSLLATKPPVRSLSRAIVSGVTLMACVMDGVK